MYILGELCTLLPFPYFCTNYRPLDFTTSLPVRNRGTPGTKSGKSSTTESGSGNTRLSLPPIDDDQLLQYRPRYICSPTNMYTRRMQSICGASPTSEKRHGQRSRQLMKLTAEEARPATFARCAGTRAHWCGRLMTYMYI